LNLPTEDDFEARIVVDLYRDSFSVLHTSNIDIEQVHAIFVAAVEYIEAMGGDNTPPKFLN
jgi:hypothetical protein